LVLPLPPLPADPSAKTAAGSAGSATTATTSANHHAVTSRGNRSPSFSGLRGELTGSRLIRRYDHGDAIDSPRPDFDVRSGSPARRARPGDSARGTISA
jgi:hypothetical protein